MEQLREKQDELVALKSGMDADLQAMDRADEMEGQVVTAVGRVTSLISGYQADVDKYNGLRTEFQQRLAVLRDKVEHLPDAVPNPPADFARLTATMMASWRDRLAEFSGVGADVPLAPPSADAQASAVNARIEAENLISALRAAADACGVDTGADAVNTANGLAASIAAGLAAAGNAPQTTASCPSPNQPQGQPPAGSVTGADASNVTGFEPVKTDEKTVGQPPTGATTGTDTKPPAGATGTDATNPTGAGQTGFEPTKTDERTAPTGAGQGITLAGTTASDQIRADGATTQPRSSSVGVPSDPGELEGDWLQCGMNTPENHARCLGRARNTSGGTITGFVVRFTKSGSQYAGRFAPGSRLGEYSATDWFNAYRPEDEKFRLTRTSSNKYRRVGVRVLLPAGYRPGFLA